MFSLNPMNTSIFVVRFISPSSKEGEPSFLFFLMFVFGLFSRFFRRWFGIPLLHYGMDPTVSVSEDDPEMKGAIEHARETLDHFFRVFENCPSNCSDFSLKLRIQDKNGSEHFWIRDIRKESGKIMGKISNYPKIIQNVAFGDEVEVDTSAVSDWGYFQNGIGEGFYTTKVLLKNMPRCERRQMKQYFGWK